MLHGLSSAHNSQNTGRNRGCRASAHTANFISVHVVDLIHHAYDELRVTTCQNLKGSCKIRRTCRHTCVDVCVRGFLIGSQTLMTAPLCQMCPFNWNRGVTR